MFVSYSQVAQVSDLSPQQIEPALQSKNKTKLKASWGNSVESKRRKKEGSKMKIRGRTKQEKKKILQGQCHKLKQPQSIFATDPAFL